MPETKTIKIGEKTFEIRKFVPYQVIDLALQEYSKLESITEDDQRAFASLKLRNMLMVRMVMKPKIDEAYLENEADLDEVELSFDLLAEVSQAIEARFNNIKKKHPKLFDSKPDPQGWIGP